MADDFKLKAPGSSLVTTQFAAELLTTLQGRNERKARTRPILVSWAMRMPIGIHRQLQRAADKHNINMTDIVVEALRRTLPALLSEDELKSAASQVEEES